MNSQVDVFQSIFVVCSLSLEISWSRVNESKKQFSFNNSLTFFDKVVISSKSVIKFL